MSTISRVGIRIYLSVGTGGEPITAFTIDTMTASRNAAGHPVVTADVHNTERCTAAASAWTCRRPAFGEKAL